MIEFIKHFFGVCSDGHAHPTFWWLLTMGGTAWFVFKHHAMRCWDKGCKICQKTFKFKKL